MRRYVVFSSMILALSTCKSRSASSLRNESDETSLSSSANPKLCVGIRGNGHYISAHFGALARIVEDNGIVDGVAGGSSGAISAFLYESIRMNPGVDKCTSCTDLQRRARLSLLLKSTRGLITTAQKSQEAAAVTGLYGEVQKLAQGWEQISKVDPVEAAKDLQILINQSTIASLLNWELFGMLYQAGGKTVSDLTELDVRKIIADPATAQRYLERNPHLKYAMAQIQEAFATFGSFSAGNQEIFFRPGVIDFFAFIEAMGRVGDFYAGRGPYDAKATEEFLATCSGDLSFGKPWSQMTTGPGAKCADMFTKLANNYFAKHGNARIADSRLNDPIGKFVTTMVPTAVYEGQANLAAIETSQRNYFNELPPQFNVPFSQVKAGYWGPADLPSRVCAEVKQSGDEKGSRCVSLGGGTWGDILPYSPAEPGLARMQRIKGTDRVSVGGWVDLAPIDALKAIGCQNIVYLTRRRDESPFVAGVALQLNMDKGDPKKTVEHRLFDYGEKTSSLSRSIKRADMVWCTDWNSFTDFEVDGMMDEAFCPETVINNASSPFGPYSKSRQVRSAVRGCTFGAPDGSAGGDDEICGVKRPKK